MPDAVVTALVNAGAFGPIVLYFMWKDSKGADRAEARTARVDDKMDAMILAMNNLIRMTGIEVMTRPNVAQRTRDETKELLDTIERQRSDR